MDTSNPGDFVGVRVGRVVVGTEVVVISVTAVVSGKIVIGKIVGTAVVGRDVFNVVGAIVVTIDVIFAVGTRVNCVVGFVTYPLFPISGFWSWMSRLPFWLVMRGALGEFTELSAQMV